MQINRFFDLSQRLTPEDFSPALKDEKEGFIRMDKSVSYWQDAWRRLRRNKLAMAALIVIVIAILFAFLGPVFSPYTYDQQINGHQNMHPCAEHPFGTDNLGRDLLVRTMYGARISLSIGIVASLIVLIVGCVYGAISGFFGGLTDNIMMRFAELIYSIPDVLFVILLSVILKDPLEKLFNTNSFFKSLSIVGPGIISIFITFGVLYWVGMARIIRGQILQLKEMEYINAARSIGASKTRLIFKHLLPNCVGTIIVTTMLQIPSAIFLESFLSFIGLGISAPMASLGSLAADALSGVYSYPYRLIFPSVAIIIIILSFNLFGDGLRDALDPRLKK